MVMPIMLILWTVTCVNNHGDNAGASANKNDDFAGNGGYADDGGYGNDDDGDADADHARTTNLHDKFRQWLP